MHLLGDAVGYIDLNCNDMLRGEAGSSKKATPKRSKERGVAVHELGHAAPLSSTPGSFVANFFIVLAGDVVGLLLIAAAFSRHSLGATTELLFWSGLAMVLLPSFYVLIRPWAKTWQTVILLAQLAISLYLIKILRLPHAVGFDDEFGHFRQLKATMSSGNPFTYNPILPIIGHYPGLPIVTSTVAWVSRLPAFTAAMIVIGAARIASLISIFFIAKAFSRERTAPAIACMVFIGGPTYLYFDAQYGYESLGFPLALAAIAVALSIYQAGTPRKIQWLWVAFVLLAAGATVTHHLSSGFMLATLGFMALFAGVQKIGNWRRLIWATGVSAVFVLVWTLIESPGSLTYVGNQSVKPFSNFLSGGGSVRAPFSTTFLAAPVWERIFSITVQLGLAVLVVYAAWIAYKAWRNGEALTWVAVAGLIYPATSIARLVPGINEAANRASGFTMVWAALLLATYLPRPSEWKIRGRALYAVGGVLIVMSGFMAGTSYYQRYPIPFYAGGPGQADSYERAAAEWMSANIPEGTTYCTDRIFTRVVGAYSFLTPVSQISPSKSFCRDMFVGPVWTSTMTYEAQYHMYQYIVVDTRLSDNIPPDGNFFDVEKGTTYTKPLPKSALTKFANQRHLELVYSNGPIRIYRNTFPFRVASPDLQPVQYDAAPAPLTR